MDAFYDKVHDPVSNGAVLFAVCRGKVSTYYKKNHFLIIVCLFVSILD